MSDDRGRYAIFDERYMVAPDRASVISVEDSIEKAQRAIDEQGYPGVIVDTFDANDTGLWHAPKGWK